MTPPNIPVAPVPDTPPHTTITPTLVADFHGVTWQDSSYVIDLDEVTSLQWNFTNQFVDPVYLEIQLVHRGLWKGYFALDNNNKLDNFAFVWFERDQRYFISNTSSFKSGLTYIRGRLIKLDGIPNTYPVCVQFDINEPRADERYYSVNSKIDESNRKRRDDFRLERKLHTNYWSIKVNTSIIGMDYVDTYYLSNYCYCWYEINPAEFY